MSWHYANGKHRVGPLDDTAIKALIASKVIQANTLVWREGMPQWTPAAQSELASMLPADANSTASTPPPLPGGPTPPDTGRKGSFCRTCSKEVQKNAVVCTACGCEPLSGSAYCHNCGNKTDPSAEICTQCGVRVRNTDRSSRSRMAAGLLGIFVGGLGVHRFYLGYTAIGFIQIIVTILTLGWGALWGLIEGILILTGTLDKDAEGKLLQD